MKIALFQFAVSRNQADNHRKILNAISDAADNGAKVIVTQECAMSGYPPVEIDSVDDIDFEEQDKAAEEIRDIATSKNIHVFLGMIRRDKACLKNSVMIIRPDGAIDYYDKRALWGWDRQNFQPGSSNGGIIDIDGIRIGIRICFEIRFPEYFRELYRQHADIALVSFCDVNSKADPYRYDQLKTHLVTRAVENAFTVVAVNSASMQQCCPTCIIDPDGVTVGQAEPDRDTIVYYEYQKQEAGFGRQGRIFYSDKLAGSRTKFVDN